MHSIFSCQFHVNFKPESILWPFGQYRWLFGQYRWLSGQFQASKHWQFQISDSDFNPIRSDSNLIQSVSVRFNAFRPIQSVSIRFSFNGNGKLPLFMSIKPESDRWLFGLYRWLFGQYRWLSGHPCICCYGGFKKHIWPLKVLKIFILISLMFVNYI